MFSFQRKTINILSTLLFIVLSQTVLKGQNRSNIWMLGSQDSGNNVAFDFNQGFLTTLSLYREMTFFITDASICDTSGNILFYTNGTYIANKNNDTLLHSKDFNSGYLTDIYYQGFGLGTAQGGV